MTTIYVPTRMTGRCFNGAERDGGRLWHAVVRVTARGQVGWHKARCGAEPGRKGNGWSEEVGKAVTCPKCLAAPAVDALPAEQLTPAQKAARTRALARERARPHDCDANAVPYKSDGPLGHGWECGICQKFLQAG